MKILHRCALPVACATALCAADAPAPKPASAKICTTCHTTAPDNLRGHFDNFAPKSNSFQLKIDERMEVLRFDKATVKVITPEPAADVEAAFKGIAKGHEVRVQFTEKDGVKTATVVAVKPPVKLAANETITLDEVQKLVAMGPEKGKYFLFDSRPAPRFMEGAIPTAVNLPFPAFDKQVDKLPADKNALVVFYCSGKTCNMSPGSLAKARQLGYTHAKVFIEGMPAWAKKQPGVLSPASLKAAYVDTQTPMVVLDARSAAEAAKGFLKGSVAADPNQLADLLKTFPAAKLKPPVVVVDETGGETAKGVAMALVKAGYAGVNVLSGGFKAWQAAALPVETGALAAKATFVPRPRPGSISPADFTRIAEASIASRPALILDVRNADETKNGVIKGALLIPEPQLLARLSEIPRDRPVICHCSTGIRAELAYHLLKEKGYDVRFLPTEITIIDTGEFTID
ncbi:MAG: sulfurtransferase [Geothrix sp.]|uniref:rhodanese-like domain-containing protein n=1 Tax=Geothrix sp. TaxID=1962974 RepID=UPI00185EF5C7|nr:rhodanese-like domain-containing protein [Geothrix sp.]NWJ40921.1 sulfurtransferase [Geothrix sp.]WIL21079.1 MAG: rhodanese-like domain-containing protein [Geothrix sp.]